AGRWLAALSLNLLTVKNHKDTKAQRFFLTLCLCGFLNAHLKLYCLTIKKKPPRAPEFPPRRISTSDSFYDPGRSWNSIYVKSNKFSLRSGAVLCYCCPGYCNGGWDQCPD